MKNAVVFLVLILAALPDVQAQTFGDKVYANYLLTPNTAFRERPGSSSPYYNLEVQIGAPPIRLHKRLQWINTAYARLVEYNFRDMSPELNTLSERLYDLRYGMIFIYQLGHPKWSLLAAPRLLVRSDFRESFSGNNVFVSGLLLANYNPDGNNRLVWSFGFTLTNDFNRNLLIPIAGLTYKDEKYTIEVAYPRVNLLYKPVRRVEWGITGSIDGAIFRRQGLALAGNPTARHVRIINVFAGQAFHYNLYKNLWFNSQVGYAFLRNYDLMDADFQAIKFVDTDLKGSFFFKTGVSVRFGN